MFFIRTFIFTDILVWGFSLSSLFFSFFLTFLLFYFFDVLFLLLLVFHKVYGILFSFFFFKFCSFLCFTLGFTYSCVEVSEMEHLGVDLLLRNTLKCNNVLKINACSS